jgi:serine/threonine protein kinase
MPGPGDPVRPAADPGVGTALAGRYVLEARIGTGGAGVVWRAHDDVLDRRVAVKLLHPYLAREAEMRERFRREAEAAAQLVHPHVCPILDFGVTDAAVYLVMPYFKGGSLADRVYVHRTVAPASVAAAAAQVATGLDYAHRLGIVHRDVKPDNILYDEDGNSVITDFGIATARFHGRLTATGRAMGTPHYMSPEQAMGKLIDGRSDIYGLGVVMYEALVGQTEMVSFGLDLSRSTTQALGDSFIQGLPYVVLILIMVGAQYYQQKQVSARNTAGDVMPQQKIMLRVMPAVFALISLNFAAALVVYWVTSSIYRIGVQGYITRTLYSGEDSLGAKAQAAAAEARKGKGSAAKTGNSPAKGSTPKAPSTDNGAKSANGKAETPASKPHPRSKKKKRKRR